MKRILGIGVYLVVIFSTFAKESVVAGSAVADTKIISSIEQVESLLFDTRKQFLPIAPPNDLRYIHSFEIVLPVDWEGDGWPESMRSQMFAEMGSAGSGKTLLPFYRLTILQDYWTGASIYFNSYGTEVLRRPSKAMKYDPYAWAKSHFKVNSAMELSTQQQTLYHSSKIGLEILLLPEIFFEAYQTEQALAAQSTEMVPKGMMAMGAGSTSMVVGLSADTNGLVSLSLTPPLSGFGAYVEIFNKQNLIYPQLWSVAKNRIAVTGGVETVWIDSASSNNPTMFYLISDATKDDDGDGYSNLREIHVEGTISTNFNWVNNDGDTMHDWYEIMLFDNLNQNGNGDFDGDGLLNDEEMVLHPAEGSNTAYISFLADPSLYDTDADGMNDKLEVIDFPFLDPLDPSDSDYDHDGLNNWEEYQLGTGINNWDSDNDTLPDGIEVEYGTDPTIWNDIHSDSDGDSLSLGDEYNHGTDPNLPDSDGDGTDDGDEADQGSNPADGSDEGTPPPADDIIELKLSIGDHSGSRSEIYEMTIEGERTIRLHSGNYGNVAAKTFKFKRGGSYNVELAHVGSIYITPDYDYTAKVEATDESQGTTASNGIVIKDTNNIFGIHEEGLDFFAAGKTAVVHVVKISGIPLGGSTNLNTGIIGKVYIPTKWGGELTLSGGNVELFYTNGDDLDYDTAIKIIDGELDDDRIAQGDPCLYVVAENEKGWYYVKTVEESDVAVSATFTQKGEAATIPWNGWYWPVSDAVSPNLYSETGSYTPLKDYDAVYGTTARAAEEAFSSGSTDSWEGHCWGWMLASVALPQPAATTTNGVVFNQDEMEGLYSELGDHITGYGWDWKVGAPDNEIPPGPPTTATGEALDAWPDDLHNALREHIRKDKKAMIADLRAEGGGDSSEVWNHAIYKYESVMKQLPGSDEKVIEVTTTITSNIDIPAMPADSDKRQDTYVYILEYGSDGIIDGTSENQNWKSTTGFVPAHLGTVDEGNMTWLPSEHCGITKEKVDALY